MIVSLEMTDLQTLALLLSSSPVCLPFSSLQLDLMTDTEKETLKQELVTRISPMKRRGMDLFDSARCPVEVRASTLKSIEWLCENHTLLQKSFLIEELCTPITVPDSLKVASDKSLATFIQSFDSVRSQAIGVKDELFKIHDSFPEIRRLTVDIERLQLDRSTLKDKLDSLRTRLSRNKHLQAIEKELLLRKRLSNRIVELESMEEQLNRCINIQKDASGDQLGEIQFLDLVSSFSDKLEGAKRLLSENSVSITKLVDELKNLEAYRDRLNSVEETFLASDIDIEALEGSVASLNESLSTRREASRVLQTKTTTESNEKMLVYYEQYRIVRGKSEALSQSLIQTRKDLKKSLIRLKEEESNFEQRTGSRFISEEELSLLIAEVRQKGQYSKQLKQSNNERSAEVRVLLQTVKTLEQEIKLHGVISESLEDLKRVSEEAARIDKTKEQSVLELSSVITALSKKMREKRTLLGPKLLELKRKRDQLTAIKNEIARVQESNDLILAPSKQRADDLQMEVTELKEKIERLRDETERHSRTIVLMNRIESFEEPESEHGELEARLEALEQEKTRLLDKLNQVEKKTDVTKIQQHFAGVQAIIERLLSYS
jgi:DNA repair exonuclease SbcCD ATPase subunit